MTTGRYARLKRNRHVPGGIDEQRVIILYRDERWSIRAIAYELDAVYATVRDILINNQVPLRGPDEPSAVSVSNGDYIRARKAIVAGKEPPPKLGSINAPEIERIRRMIGWDESWVEWARDPAWELEEAS